MYQELFMATTINEEIYSFIGKGKKLNLPKHILNGLKALHDSLMEPVHEKLIKDETKDWYDRWYKSIVNGEVNGLLYLKNSKPVSLLLFTTDGPKKIYVENVATLPTERGKGFSRKLFAELFDNYPGASYELTVVSYNANAKKLYESMGFEFEYAYDVMTKRG